MELLNLTGFKAILSKYNFTQTRSQTHMQKVPLSLLAASVPGPIPKFSWSFLLVIINQFMAQTWRQITLILLAFGACQAFWQPSPHSSPGASCRCWWRHHWHWLDTEDKKFPLAMTHMESRCVRTADKDIATILGVACRQEFGKVL